jgi:uncharacterized membrane protein
MKSRVVFAGHSVHAMLIAFPLGLLATSVLWDILALVTHHPRWEIVAFWSIFAGVAGALLAAVPGFIDWLAIPRGTRARELGAYHLVMNLAVIALFTVSLIGRWQTPGGYELAGPGWMILGWLGVGFAVVSSWLGGELVETLGISVSDGANPDAPSSLGERRAHKAARSRSVPAHRGA